MGVRGLETYMEVHCPNAAVKVNIAEIVSNYKIKTGNENPVIVVDGMNCSRPLYGNLEWINGGQYKQLVDNLRFFVNQFKKMGVKLVFFFDGPTVDKKRPTWVQRRMKTMHDVYQIFDILDEGKKISEIDKHLVQLPTGINSTLHHFFKHECGCDVYQSLSECDEEIVSYANNHNCFAILGQDTDYVIYEGNYTYLSIARLDINKMTTIQYDRKALARHLRIGLQDLALLATLKGNDTVSGDDLRAFHRYLVRRTYGPRVKPHHQNVIPSIAFYIEHLPRNRYENLQKLFSDIAYGMFGDRQRMQLLLTSFESYSAPVCNEPARNLQDLTGWEAILVEAKHKHKTYDFPAALYSVLQNLPYESGCVIEDYRLNDLKPSAAVLRPLRQRIYGILLHEKPGKEFHKVRELCLEGPGTLFDEKLVEHFSPRAHHPGLLTLWRSETVVDINSKWNLFVKSVSNKLDVECIRNLPGHLVIPTLIASYLTEEKSLLSWEIDAIIATAVVLEDYHSQRLADLPSDVLSTRAIRIAPLVIRAARGMKFLSASCGYPLNQKYSALWMYFDGKLFQMKYLAAQKATMLELCDNNVTFMENFQKVKSVISMVE